MKCLLLFCAVLLLVVPIAAPKRHVAAPFPESFEIGRHTFFDFGPPFDFYEILVIRSAIQGSSAERLLLTPEGAACLAPATIETSTASLQESVPVLLRDSNPCEIPEKELHRELKRCKKCLVFSGANVVMRVHCGSGSRLIRSDILDRDMFASTPNTPKHTSWTMELLSRLDQGLGPGVMQKPTFPSSKEVQATGVNLDPSIQLALESGSYDELFPVGDYKPSQLYRETQVHHPSPTVKLVSATPFAPREVVLPEYPPLAKAARLQGDVAFSVPLDADGKPGAPMFTQGNPLFYKVVTDALSNWKFPQEAAGQLIWARMQFSLNCPKPTK